MRILFFLLVLVIGVNAQCPSVLLPPGYALVWNQDFTSPAYHPFNVPAIVSGTPGATSIWHANYHDSIPGLVYTATDHFPFSTDAGYLDIQGWNNSGRMNGGVIASVDVDNVTGFSAANAYWEAKIRLPGGGVGQWPAFWLYGINPGGPRGEIDVMEFGYQRPNSTNGHFQIHTHLWGGGFSGQSEGDYEVSSLANTPGDWHVFGCLIQPGTISIYLDSNLVTAFTPSLAPAAFNGGPPLQSLATLRRRLGPHRLQFGGNETNEADKLPTRHPPSELVPHRMRGI
jgi:Glycosyl hydrolases family 16